MRRPRRRCAKHHAHLTLERELPFVDLKSDTIRLSEGEIHDTTILVAHLGGRIEGRLLDREGELKGIGEVDLVRPRLFSDPEFIANLSRLEPSLDDTPHRVDEYTLDIPIVDTDYHAMTRGHAKPVDIELVAKLISESLQHVRGLPRYFAPHRLDRSLWYTNE